MNITINRNQSKTIHIPIKRFNGHSDNIAFSVQTPSGISGIITPSNLGGGNDGEIQVNLTVSGGSSSGTRTVTVYGSPPALSGSVEIDVYVPEVVTTSPPTTSPSTTATPVTTQPATTTETPFSSSVDFSHVNVSGRTFNFTANGWVNRGYITGYSWNFGDGNIGSGQTVSHTYTSNGTYTVTVTATFSEGGSGRASLPLPVYYVAPTTTSTTTRPPVVYRELSVQRVVMGTVNNVIEYARQAVDFPAPTITQPAPSYSTELYRLGLTTSRISYMYFTNLYDVPEGYALSNAELLLPITGFSPSFVFSSNTSTSYTNAASNGTLDVRLLKVYSASATPQVFVGDKNANGSDILVLPFKNAGFGSTSSMTIDTANTIKTHSLSLSTNIQDYISGLGLNISSTWSGSTGQLRSLAALPSALVDNPEGYVAVDTSSTKIKLTFNRI